MIGKRHPQSELFDVGNVYPLALKPGTFHAQLAHAAGRLFRDDDFAALYSERLGRPSVPPSLLALTVLLQHEAGVSDEEAVSRTAYDLRWAAVLGRQAGEPLCAKSTLQLFRAHLVLHDQVRNLFQASLLEARRAGLLRGQALRVALDTKPIQGRGAVLDTYNLLAGGIRQLAAALARSEGKKLADWLCEHSLQSLEPYAQPRATSIKGSAEVDWSDPAARNGFLAEIVSAAQQLLTLASGGQSGRSGRSGPQIQSVQQAAQLLGALLLQDVETATGSGGPFGGAEAGPQACADASIQVSIKAGTTPGRMPSVTDPEQRHGHKSESRLFTGFKASVAVDTHSQVIVAADVLPADAGDATGALSLVEEAETNTALPVEQTLGDCAYGGGPTRQEFTEAGRDLIARVPAEWHRDGLYPKSAFVIDLDHNTVTCPAGHTTRASCRTSDGGRKFFFGGVCASCPLRMACTQAKRGRTVQVHAQEAQLRAARAFQRTPEGRRALRERVVVEHRLARLGQLGIGQARYLGRVKTRFQLLMAATIANLRRTWNWQRDQAVRLPLLPIPRAQSGDSLRPVFPDLWALRPIFSVFKSVLLAAN